MRLRVRVRKVVVAGVDHRQTTDSGVGYRRKRLAVEELHREGNQQRDAIEVAGAAVARGVHRPGPLRGTWKGQPWWITPVDGGEE